MHTLYCVVTARAFLISETRRMLMETLMQNFHADREESGSSV